MGFFSSISKKIYNRNKNPTREVATQTSSLDIMVQVEFVESESEFYSYDDINPFFILRDLEVVSSRLSEYGEHYYPQNIFEDTVGVKSTITHGSGSLATHDDFQCYFTDKESSIDSGLGCCSDSDCGSTGADV